MTKQHVRSGHSSVPPPGDLFSRRKNPSAILIEKECKNQFQRKSEIQRQTDDEFQRIDVQKLDKLAYLLDRDAKKRKWLQKYRNSLFENDRYEEENGVRSSHARCGGVVPRMCRPVAGSASRSAVRPAVSARIQPKPAVRKANAAPPRQRQCQSRNRSPTAPCRPVVSNNESESDEIYRKLSVIVSQMNSFGISMEIEANRSESPARLDACRHECRHAEGPANAGREARDDGSPPRRSFVRKQPGMARPAGHLQGDRRPRPQVRQKSPKARQQTVVIQQPEEDPPYARSTASHLMKIKDKIPHSRSPSCSPVRRSRSSSPQLIPTRDTCNAAPSSRRSTPSKKVHWMPPSTHPCQPMAQQHHRCGLDPHAALDYAELITQGVLEDVIEDAVRELNRLDRLQRTEHAAVFLQDRPAVAELGRRMQQIEEEEMLIRTRIGSIVFESVALDLHSRWTPPPCPMSPPGPCPLHTPQNVRPPCQEQPAPIYFSSVSAKTSPIQMHAPPHSPPRAPAPSLRPLSLVVPTAMVASIQYGRREFTTHLQQVRCIAKGSFNPWRLGEEISESILDHCLGLVVAEIDNFEGELIDAVERAEFHSRSNTSSSSTSSSSSSSSSSSKQPDASPARSWPAAQSDLEPNSHSTPERPAHADESNAEGGDTGTADHTLIEESSVSVIEEHEDNPRWSPPRERSPPKERSPPRERSPGGPSGVPARRPQPQPLVEDEEENEPVREISYASDAFEDTKDVEEDISEQDDSSPSVDAKKGHASGSHDRADSSSEHTEQALSVEYADEFGTDASSQNDD